MMNPTRSLTDVQGLKVGSAEDMTALTGCTVVLTEATGAVCGVDVRGSSPGTRETDLLNPINMIEKVHAILLSGGSAYGLDAAGGVMRYLEEQGIGHRAGRGVVPIVPAAVLFDLEAGDFHRRPDADMAYAACQAANLSVREGNVGAGAGATVGKIRGMEYCSKSGQGTWSYTMPGSDLTVSALVAVNSLGDVIDPRDGSIIAGVRDDRGQIIGTEIAFKAMSATAPEAGTNTTIGVVASNARLNKSQANKVAQMAHDGLARSISPIHTLHDGDTIFALATGEVEADVSVVGFISQQVMMRAVVRAVQTAETVLNFRCWRD